MERPDFRAVHEHVNKGLHLALFVADLGPQSGELGVKGIEHLLHGAGRYLDPGLAVCEPAQGRRKVNGRHGFTSGPNTPEAVYHGPRVPVRGAGIGVSIVEASLQEEL